MMCCLSLLGRLALVTLSLGLAACAQQAPGMDGKLHFGVSAPMSGDNAEYARLWREGFQIALDDLNSRGGVRGRQVVLDWEDSQSDPKQSVNIAQAFVDDPRILAVIGDFSSPSSMAASPIYQRGGVVQMGFTNSHPDFTHTGNFMFSTSPTQKVVAGQLVELAQRHGHSAAIVYVNNDWGRGSADIFLKDAAAANLNVLVAESFSDTTSDFRPLLLKVRDSGAQVLVIQSYYKSAALIVRQARQIGLDKLKIVWGNYSEAFITLAGSASEGVSVGQSFYAQAARPSARDFVRRFQQRYGRYPDQFNAGGYDTVMQLAWAAGQQAQPSREGVREALAQGRDIPSVIYGPFAFDQERRVSNPGFRELVIRHGRFVPVESTAVAN